MGQSLITLIKKFDRPGPRYTSYPPAPTFTTSFGSQQYITAIEETERNPDSSDISLYFHFPFCDTLCYFCGCTTVITRNRDRIGEYLQYLKKEIDLLAPMLNAKRKAVQVHWGGGTPTYLSPAQIRDIGMYIRKSFAIADDAEMSVEIDPRELTYQHMKALREVGFNRVSLGVQDFDPKVQLAVNRNQSEFITRQAIDWSRTLGFKSLNLDLIYGLPMQTVESFSSTLEKVIEIAPERIAVYNFAFVPWMKKHQVLIHPEDMPSPDTKLELLTTTIEKLSNAGYVYIGMDHFGEPDDELTVAQRSKTLRRNFQGYSTKAGSDMYGLGMSAIGHFAGYYAQSAKTLPEYYAAIDKNEFATHVGYTMTADDEIRKFVIMKLMCDLSLEKQMVEQKFSITFDSYFSNACEKLEPLIEEGLLNATPASLEVTNLGRMFLRNIAMCFDAHLAPAQKSQPVFSRTI